VRKLNTCKFGKNKGFVYHYCGLFTSPTPEWMHLTRILTDYELFIVTKGTLYIANEKESYTVSTGEYLIMPPSFYQHGYKASDCSFYWLHFADTNPDEQPLKDTPGETASAGDFIEFPLTGKLSAPDRIMVYIEQLTESDRLYHDNFLNNIHTALILNELNNQLNTEKNYSLGNRGNMKLFNDIKDYVSWHISENIRICDIAAYFGYNEKYLSAYFKKYSQINLKQYIILAKTDRAKRELCDTKNSIAQIAYSIGFSDAHNFSNAFKKVTGITPSVYRSTYGEGITPNTN